MKYPLCCSPARPRRTRRPSPRLGAGLCSAALALTCSAAPAAALAPSRLGDGTEADLAPLGTRLPLVLVHGLGGSSEGWEQFLHAYQQNPSWRGAFKPYSFSYATSSAALAADPLAPRSITGVGAQLRDAIQGLADRPATAPDFGFAGKRVLILAHSMGGLVARSMMQEQVFRDGERGGEKVLRLITLGTPHHGSPLADAAIVFGLNTVAELTETDPVFLRQLTWTNYDRLDMLGGQCNPWLAQLNNYAPAAGGWYGACGRVPANPLAGYYEKIVAYGSGSLQPKDVDTGAIGIYRPGSASAFDLPSRYLLGAYGRAYANDGVVPLVSAQFSQAPLVQRAQAFACDHRLIKNGFPELVRTAAATYGEQAFCPATATGAVVPSGIQGGFAWQGSILSDPGGIVEILRTDSQAERVLDWAERAYAAFLQPAGGRTQLWSGYSYRWYPASNAYVGVRAGQVYYMGPASGGAMQWMGTLADYLAQAAAAGF